MREVGDSRKLVGLAKVDNGGGLLQRPGKRNPWIQVAVGSDMLEGDSEPVMSRSRECFENILTFSSGRIGFRTRGNTDALHRM